MQALQKENLKIGIQNVCKIKLQRLHMCTPWCIRLSKTVSSTILCPLQVVNKDMSCGCKSVGNPGYGSVLMSMLLSTFGELICNHKSKPSDHHILHTGGTKENDQTNEL
jgi:hypothetical protein